MKKKRLPLTLLAVMLTLFFMLPATAGTYTGKLSLQGIRGQQAGNLALSKVAPVGVSSKTTSVTYNVKVWKSRHGYLTFEDSQGNTQPTGTSGEEGTVFMQNIDGTSLKINVFSVDGYKISYLKVGGNDVTSELTHLYIDPTTESYLTEKATYTITNLQNWCDANNNINIEFGTEEEPETIPVVTFSTDSTTVTFTYAVESAVDYKSTYPLTWMNNNSFDEPYNPYRNKVKKVIFDPSFSQARPTNTSSWFTNFTEMQEIEGIENLNTSEVTDMGDMFYGCSKLTVLDVSKFNTDKVISMGSMFYGCSGLTTLDVSKFNTDNVTIMDDMFWGCKRLTALDVSRFNTGKVIAMGGMFGKCSGLTTLDVSKFNTDEVVSMGGMFLGCSGLTTLDVSKFNTNNVTGMGSMFYGCSGLTTLDVSKFNTNNVTGMGSMFYGCSGLTTLDVSNFNTDNVIEMGGMFSGCSSLTALDVSKFNTEKVKSMDHMFANCSGLAALDISNFKTGNVTNMGCMFENCRGLTALDVSNFNTEKVTNMIDMFWGCNGIKALDVSNFNTYNVTDMGGMFSGCSSLTALDVSKFNTNNVTNMTRMFSGCSSLTALNVSKFNTEKVTSMSWMFFGCSSLTELNVINFNTDNVTDMNRMFYGCRGLTTLIVSTFNTGNVTDMEQMFYGCNSLNTLDLSNFNTEKVRNMSWMFYCCTGLKTLNISNFNTGNVTNMSDMFWGCRNLTVLDVSNFNTEKVTNMSWMFIGCSGLTSLDVSNFNTDNVRSMDCMFYGCSALRKINLGNNDFKKAASNNKLFEKVGTQVSPCMLTIGQGFDRSVLGKHYTGTPDYYIWRGGYMSLSSASIVSTLDNTIYVNDTIAHSGKQLKLSVRMKNAEKILGLQFDLHLPDGFSVNQSTNGKYNLAVSTARNADESLDYHPSNMISENVYRVIAVSTQHITIAPGDDEVLTLVLDVDKSVPDSDYTLTMDSIKLVKDDLGSIDLDSITLRSTVTTYSYVMGDVNDNGKIDVQDIAILADYILKKNPTNFVLLAADMNDDGKIDVADLAAIADQILKSGSKAKASRKVMPRKAEGSVSGNVADYDNIVYLNAAQATAGEQLALTMRLKNTEKILGLQFDLHLPDGFSVDQSTSGKYNLTVSTARNADESLDYHPSNMISENAYRAIAVSTQHITIAPGDDEVLTLVLNVDKSVAPGEYAFTLDSIKLVKDDLGSIDLSGVSFQSPVTVEAGFDGVVLNEDSPTAPEKSDGAVNVKVKRTMTGGEWATLCLPFAMTGTQVKAAFGDDVQLADYAGWSSTYASEDDDYPSTLTVNFSRVDAANGIEANHPYIIRPAADITSFVANGVTISPESSPSVTTGKKREHNVGTFTGIYVAGFTVPEATLFISANKFWYSVGKTKMKAFRAYFEFEDVLGSYYDGSSAKVQLAIGDATGIGRMSVNPSAPTGRVYTLGGQLVSTTGTAHLSKGIYLVDGKKIVVK